MPFPTPQGRQKEVLYLPAAGHTAVLGTAGSGKTTLAILRAAYLADKATPHSGKTLLVTFTRTLVSYLKHLQDSRMREVKVEHYHQFARGYLAHRSKLGYGQICTPSQRRGFLESALKKAVSFQESSPDWRRHFEGWSGQLRWSYQMCIRDHSTFQSRLGCSEADARRFWQVRTDYERIRTSGGKLFDWDDIALAVSDELALDIDDRLYKHIVIDEGQDFSPAIIRSLVAAVPDDGSITFFGDVAQQIFGADFTWRDAGLKIGEPWLFCENYRNSSQIASLALAITGMPYYEGVADIVQPRQPTAAGPKPLLVLFQTKQREIDFVIDQAVNFSRVGTIAILTRDRSDESTFLQRFKAGAFQRLHRDIAQWDVRHNLSIGTYHSAKGLEFDSVILPFVSDTRLPDPDSILDIGLDKASASDGRLLYVGTTRAKSSLVFTSTGQPTKLLPAPGNLYSVTTRE
jgi:superfamily I DNA/RNA helicase